MINPLIKIFRDSCPTLSLGVFNYLMYFKRNLEGVRGLVSSLLWIEDSNAERETLSGQLTSLLRQYFPRLVLNTTSPEKIACLDLQKNHYELVLTHEQPMVRWANGVGIDVILWEKLSDLGAKLDVFLQLQRYKEDYPLQLDNWILQEVIHHGQDAVIYRAVNKEGMTVAIKRFKYQLDQLSDELIKGFLTRIDIQCGLRSKGLVQIIEGGMSNHVFYLVMEYMHHGTLRQSLNSCGILPLPHALEWFREIAESITCVHQAGLIHRDLKTENIMLREDGTLALSDYGVSKRILLDSGFITEEEIHCSPYYVSPEQVSGEECTQASDIYSLGVIFYELITGEKPFCAKQVFELMMLHVMAPVPELPEELGRFQTTLNGMLAKDYHERFPNALEAIKSLPLVI